MATPTTLEERLRIAQWAEAGITDRDIAQKMNRSIETVRKWRRRAQRQGRAGLACRMGRPRRGAMSTFAAPLRQRVLQLRSRHPGWGAKTLRAELGDHGPSAATIGRLLKQEGLPRRYERPSRLPAPKTPPVRRVHQRWQLDARGNEAVARVGTIALIALKDLYSHVRLLSYPCALARPQSHPTWEHYQMALRWAFCDWGLPEQLQVDHESVFFDNTTKSPFPTRLHLWLTGLGIELVFSGRGRPTDQASVARSHQLWFDQVVLGRPFARWQALFEALCRRRDFQGPRSRSLDGVVDAVCAGAVVSTESTVHSCRARGGTTL